MPTRYPKNPPNTKQPTPYFLLITTYPYWFNLGEELERRLEEVNRRPWETDYPRYLVFEEDSDSDDEEVGYYTAPESPL